MMADNHNAHDDVPMEDAATFNPRRDLETEEDLDEKFPDRPRNTRATLYFRTLCQDLLEPLQKLSIRGPSAPKANAKRRQPFVRKGPYQQRLETIERFIQHWRHDVGKDLYPAFRLILPDKDSDRQVFGLKEQALGRLLVKILGLDPKRSDDAKKLINWKVPLGGFSSDGDFPAKCHSALQARSMLTDPGNMTIGEVNELLDQLSIASKAEERLPILRQFYHKMNAEEMTWLIRIILKQMRIGTGHETFLRLMHEGAPSKWSSTSSLRTVCWTMFDETCAWDGNVSVEPFHCFQPQLCKQVNQDFDKIVERMEGTADDPEFWIQEKLDGERIQMHMRENAETGGREFAWYSRNGINYTYLYGSNFTDPSGSITNYIDKVFPYNIKNIILDGEMITWDPITKSVMPFGSLKTAALNRGSNPNKTKDPHPTFKVFDCLYANDKDVTKFTLRDRRNLLEQAVKPVDHRLELLPYWACTKAEEIEERLRQVISESSEGLVLKNPRSAYTLTTGSRSDSWIKIKPDYMQELGEHLDCIIIGAYYGSGSRGGRHSSFLVGLRVATDADQPDPDKHPQKCWSFVKVGGGYSALDYKAIKTKTDGKWHKWNRNNPPDEYIELAGGHLQHERPDEWIKPEDSLVIAVKATQVTTSDRFRTMLTLRFPRFKSLKEDKDWKSALSVEGFVDLQKDVEHQQSQKKLEIDRERQLKRRKTTASRKKAFTVVGTGKALSTSGNDQHQPNAGCFTGLEFCIMTDMDNVQPGQKRMNKHQLEQLVSDNGGVYWASPDKRGPNIICIADKKPTNVFALMKKGTHNIIRPAWLVDCVKQSQHDTESGNDHGQYLLPLEPRRHLFFAIDEGLEQDVEENLDEFGDSYARDSEVKEFETLLSNMPDPETDNIDIPSPKALLATLEEDGFEMLDLTSLLFSEQSICFYTGASSSKSTNGSADDMELDNDTNIDTINPDPAIETHKDIETYISHQHALFSGAHITSTIEAALTTHVVICPPSTSSQGSQSDAIRNLATQVRAQISAAWKPGVAIPRLVTRDWIEACWAEKTLVDEDKFAII